MASKQPNTEINMGTIADRAVNLLCDLLDGIVDLEDDDVQTEASAIIGNFLRRKRQIEKESDNAE